MPIGTAKFVSALFVSLIAGASLSRHRIARRHRTRPTNVSPARRAPRPRGAIGTTASSAAPNAIAGMSARRRKRSRAQHRPFPQLRPIPLLLSRRRRKMQAHRRLLRTRAPSCPRHRRRPSREPASRSNALRRLPQIQRAPTPINAPTMHGTRIPSPQPNHRSSRRAGRNHRRRPVGKPGSGTRDGTVGIRRPTGCGESPAPAIAPVTLAAAIVRSTTDQLDSDPADRHHRRAVAGGLDRKRNLPIQRMRWAAGATSAAIAAIWDPVVRHRWLTRVRTRGCRQPVFPASHAWLPVRRVVPVKHVFSPRDVDDSSGDARGDACAG